MMKKTRKMTNKIHRKAVYNQINQEKVIRYKQLVLLISLT
jgi:hypothetical protein